MQRLLVMFVMTQLNGCASSKRQPPAVEATAARVPQAGGNACTVEPVGRGCRVMPFEGPCVAYFTANDAELKDLQQSRYLNLRFEGDRRPFLDKPLLAPAAAHRSLVDAGGSLSSLIVLIELLGGPTSLSMDFPSGDIVQSVAYSPDYSASADRLKPGMLELLAGITDLPRVSAQWDAAIRAASPEVEYHPNASAECLALLSTIVDMARDARSSRREMYVVGSLAKYTAPCEQLGGCNGYGCDPVKPFSFGGAAVCHTPSDECFSPLDCPPGYNCPYSAGTQRFVCRPIPQEYLRPWGYP